MTIERPNGRRIDDIVDAATALEETWTQSKTWESANHFTCAEVDTLDDLLRALGAKGLGSRFIESHSQTDEPGDAHYIGDDDS